MLIQGEFKAPVHTFTGHIGPESIGGQLYPTPVLSLDDHSPGATPIVMQVALRAKRQPKIETL